MRAPTTLCLIFVACVQAQASAISPTTLPLVVKTQNTLSEQIPQVTEPKFMSDTKRLKTAKAALTSRADQWVKVSENDKEKAEACTDALEKAGYVAELASMKSNSGLEDKVFNLEKTKLLKLVSQCQQLTKISG